MSDAKTIFKWGCLGCLGLLGFAIFLVAGSFGLVWMDVKKEVPRTETALLQTEELETAGATPAGLRLVLDVGYADVKLHPVASERDLQIEATYDERTNSFEQSRSTDPDGGTVWTIAFRRTSKVPFGGLRTVLGGTRSTIRVEIPRGLPLSIEGELHDGALEGDLGGTTIRTFDVEVHRGAAVIGIDRPTLEPMQRFAVEANQAASIIGSLGNASPREVAIGCSLGGCVIDLDGEWRNDASITLDASLSGAVLSLSEDVVHQGLDDVRGFEGFDTPSGSDPEIPVPTLRFTVDGKWEIQ